MIRFICTYVLRLHFDKDIITPCGIEERGVTSISEVLMARSSFVHHIVSSAVNSAMKPQASRIKSRRGRGSDVAKAGCMVIPLLILWHLYVLFKHEGAIRRIMPAKWSSSARFIHQL